MYADERRESIAAQARTDGRVEVAALAEDLRVTPETIRRDLTELERRGILRRVHGGAMPVERFQGEPALDEKAGVMAAEKRRIAKAAIALLPPAGTIMLDAGTTTAELGVLLPERPFTVVTNGLPFAQALASRRDLEVHLLGGRVRGRTMAAVGGRTVRELGDLRVDVAFVATNGLSASRGLSTHDAAEAETKDAMIAAADRVVLLCDHSKLGVEQLVRYATLDRIDDLITDSGMAQRDADTLAAEGPEVVRA